MADPKSRGLPDRPENVQRPDLDALRARYGRLKAQREARIQAGADRLN